MGKLIDSTRVAVNYCYMDIEDNLPLHGADPLAQLIRQDLDPLSINELEGRIATLKKEISRCEAKMQAASSHRSIADALFKKE